MATRSKKADKRPNLSNLIGNAKDLMQSELPTLRQCFQYSLLVQERSVKSLTNRDKFKLVNNAIRSIWLSVHPLLVLQDEKYSLDRLIKEWDCAQKVAPKNANFASKNAFLNRLDKLFDILKCKCDIISCDNASCSGCPVGAHISCTCPAAIKIPHSELKFIMLSRKKVGVKGDIQIGSVDTKESKRVSKMLKRKASREKSENIKRSLFYKPTSSIESQQSSNDDSDNAATASSQSAGSEYDSSDSSHVSYNMMDVTKISAAAIRYDVSNRAAAAISTATLVAAKDADLLRKDVCEKIAIDHNKIKRSKSKLISATQEKSVKEIKDSRINAILFDGKKDITKVLNLGSDGKYHPSDQQEDHYSICSEPGGDYLTHLTLDPKEKGNRKPAQHLADEIFQWLQEHDIDKILEAIGGDSTAVNTGWKGGAIALLEKRLNRKLIWLICALHTNELPLRHLMIKLDGRTISDNRFEGPIGKLILTVLDLKIKENIPPIDIEITLVDLDSEILADLSSDQKYLYDIVTAIKTGHLTENIKNKKIGPHHHARWLNLANRLCRLWCSEHNLDDSITTKLKQIVQFVCAVYAPMWFLIKKNNKWFNGPGLILQQLHLARQLDQSIQNMVMPHIQSTAWNAHPEVILQSMLVSDQQELRDFAVAKIISIRKGSTYGNTSHRPYRMPVINTEATDLRDLIEWSNPDVQLHEPLLTCNLNSSQLMDIIETKMKVPDFPVHGQSIERCVKIVSKASATVFGKKTRDGFIKATLLHRKLMSSNESKQDLMSLFD